jgi:ornithine cyclodeaminase
MSEVLVLTQADVTSLLPMAECIEVVEEALRSLGRGEALLPVRSSLWLPDRSGLLGVMPGYLAAEGILGSGGILGVKAITVMPGNHGTPYDSHQGVVLLFEAKQGRPLALVDATSVTAIRTAATSAVATRALARPDAGDLAVLGTGVQAGAHLDAIRAVRTLRRVRVWSRSAERTRAFAATESARLGTRVEAAASAREAVEGADLICTATSARDPILYGDWVAPGAHVNAVGACVPTSRELDTAAVKRARLFVDHRPAALAEAGDLLIPIREGALDESHIAGEIGDVLLGKVRGRRAPEEVTLFKSLGLAVEDLAAASRAYANALAKGVGTAVSLGGERRA